MTVYIEYVIIDNLVITALIALISYRVLKASRSWPRIAAAAVFGTAAAVVYPFISLHFAWLLLIKTAIYAALSLVLFFKKNKLLKGAAVFLLTTAVMGGIMFMVGYMAYGDVMTALVSPAYDFPVGILLLIAAVIYYVVRRLVSVVIKHRTIMDYWFDFELSLFDKTVNAKGFLDSGNLLFDEKTGLPVVVAGAALSARLLSDEQFELILHGRGESIGAGAHYIRFATLSKGGDILVLKVDKFRLYLKKGANIIKDVMLGLTFGDLGGGFEALLSPSIF